MPENKQEPVTENSRPASADARGMVGAFFAAVASAASKLWHAVTDDGHLEAFGRQGIDELGAALRAFPDSIQVDESGTLWNPTQGEVAEDRKHSRDRGASSNPPHPWPSEIASQNRHQPANDYGTGQDHGHDAGNSL
jgi:hypothetical protein